MTILWNSKVTDAGTAKFLASGALRQLPFDKIAISADKRVVRLYHDGELVLTYECGETGPVWDDNTDLTIDGVNMTISPPGALNS